MKQTFRRLKYKLQPASLILAYHRVTELVSDPQLLSVTPQHFNEHLEVLLKYCRPMSLQSLVRASHLGSLPQRGVGITFDDGYADNLYQAKPLLVRYDTPATVFVTTDYLRQDRELWWDELERLLLTPGTLPDVLRLKVNGSVYQEELGETAHYSEGAYRRYSHWSVLEKDDPSPRQLHYRSLHRLLRPLSESERRPVLDNLSASANVEPRARPTHRTLSPDEVVELADGGLIEVGAHTATHPSLSALSAQDQRVEIDQSKRRLEEILDRAVESFAYPYGTPSDYTPETVKLVREAGFSCACSNFEGLLNRNTDCYQLPRFLVRDWDGKEFESRLRKWFSG